jgi:hypothetical protein
MSRKVLISFAFIFLLVNGCRFWGGKGSGNIKEEFRDISDFSEIEVSGAFLVKIKVGESTSLKIITDDNLFKYIKTTVKGNKLVIDSKKNLKSKEEIKINITTQKLSSIECSGANTLYAEGIDEQIFDLDLSGASTANLKGKTERLSIDISGASKLNSGEFEAKNVKADVSGASSAEIYADYSLDADVSGAAHLKILGHPEKLNTDVSGAASADIID